MKCDKCGICCKLFRIFDLTSELKELDKGDGSCKYLKNNLCSIYSARPPMCNSEWVHTAIFPELNRTEYEKMLEHYCTWLKEKYGGFPADE